MMPLHPKILSSLASFKSRLVLTFLYGLPKLSWKWGRWMGAVVVVMHYQYDNWQQNRLLWYGHVLQKDKDWVKKCMEHVDLERGCGKGLLSMLRIVVDELDKGCLMIKKMDIKRLLLLLCIILYCTLHCFLCNGSKLQINMFLIVSLTWFIIILFSMLWCDCLATGRASCH